MKRLLLDLNIVLDVVLDRAEAASAGRLWAALERGKGRGFVPAHGVTSLGSKHEEHCRPPLRRPGRRLEPPAYSFLPGPRSRHNPTQRSRKRTQHGTSFFAFAKP